MQKKLLGMFAIGLFSVFAASQASAAAGNCEANAVSKDGKPLAGAAKNAFMKKCEAESKGGAADAPKATTQQQKMKDCNAEAKTKALKGDERKAFMKSCLSADKK